MQEVNFNEDGILIPFNAVKLDSFTLLIPYNKSNETDLIVSNVFTYKYKKYYEHTSELEDSSFFYTNYVKTENTSRKTFLKYKAVNRRFNDEQRDFIQIMITSKLLMNKYFDGINSSNIDQIHSYILADGIINITKEDLLRSYVSDIDLCKDFKASIEDFKVLKQLLIDLVIEEKKRLVYSKRINSKIASFGVQYNERSKATPTKPFAKLYYKTIELHIKSIDFMKANLALYEDLIKEGIARLEVTIKASDHKKRLGISFVKNLNDLLSLNSDELSRVFNFIINEYYNKPLLPKEKNKDKMTTSNAIMLGVIETMFRTNSKVTSYELLNMFTMCAYDSKQKHDIKKKFEEVLSISSVAKKISSNDRVNQVPIDILKSIGIIS